MVKTLRNITVAFATCCAALVAAFFALNVWMVADSSKHIVSLGQAVEAPRSVESADRIIGSADCIVVFGASVYADGTLSPILQNRVDAAIELYRCGAAPVIIMSGDGRESNYNEPAAMKAYAVEHGVPPEAVYCDPGGFHTFETVWRTANTFGAERVILVTQEYHLFRCVYDARAMGMEALGVVSDSGVYDEQLWYDARESVSRVVDFATVVFGWPPEQADEPIAL